MSVTVSTLAPRGFLWWATFTVGGQVVGSTLVAGRTQAQARKAAQAIAARLSPQQLSLFAS